MSRFSIEKRNFEIEFMWTIFSAVVTPPHATPCSPADRSPISFPSFLPLLLAPPSPPPISSPCHRHRHCSPRCRLRHHSPPLVPSPSITPTRAPIISPSHCCCDRHHNCRRRRRRPPDHCHRSLESPYPRILKLSRCRRER